MDAPFAEPMMKNPQYEESFFSAPLGINVSAVPNPCAA